MVNNLWQCCHLAHAHPSSRTATLRPWPLCTALVSEHKTNLRAGNMTTGLIDCWPRDDNDRCIFRGRCEVPAFPILFEGHIISSA